MRFHGHYTFCGRRIPIDLDAILANLALEEGEEKLPQVVDSIPLDPEMLCPKLPDGIFGGYSEFRNIPSCRFVPTPESDRIRETGLLNSEYSWQLI
jgi:hypothetical protein